MSSSSRKPKTYEDVDENELLATLSCEELRQLEEELEDLHPDDCVPIGLRQKDQTAKRPTENFDRDALLRYWEDENTKNLGQTPEERQKMPQKGKRLQSLPKKSVEKKEEFQRELRSKCCDEKAPLKTTEVTTLDMTVSDRDNENPIVIKEALEKVLRDDPSTSEVNLNNLQDISQETLLSFVEALTSNTHVKVFSLANTHADDRVALAISKTLCQNRSIRNLNIESNFVSGKGVLALLEALTHNSTLVELRFHNQRHICGGKVEMEMVRLLRENTTLLKLGYQFDLAGPRMAATGILTRNQDQERQRRLQLKKDQNAVAQSTQISSKKPTSSVNLHKNPTTVSPQVLSSPSCSLQCKNEQSPVETSTQALCKKPTSKINLHRIPTAVACSGGELPTRKNSEMVRHHEGSKGTSNHRRLKSKNLKNDTEKESGDILKELKNSLKPSSQKRRDELSNHPPPPLQRSGRDDLMAAIRGSGIRSLNGVRP
nr:leiomodin-2-like [Nerophis lumbriciformis]